MTQTRFPRAARLLQPDAYRRAFKHGDRYVDGCFVVIAVPNDLEVPRLGLAISKRRARLAVDRNRIKRMARERFRCWASVLPNVDIVILARSKTFSCNNQALAASLDRHWQRLIKAHSNAEASHKPTGTSHG